MPGVSAVLTDIEGTTSSIAFVKDVLFPYARRRLPSFLAAHAGDPEVRRCVDEVRASAGEPEVDDKRALEVLLRWMDEDRKATPLKTLQGLIWAEGYAAGEIVGHVHADAAAALRAWHEQGLRLYVYSSGSVAAQRLLFSHSSQGDLAALFSGFFDTGVGPKREPASYFAITRAVGLAPASILFLSDSLAELDAARAAGLRTAGLDRGEGGDCGGHGHAVFRSFEEIDLTAERE